MGASCLTDIITCQIKKENPTKTLSDFRPHSDVVRPRQPAGCKSAQVLVILKNWRRGTQVVRERSAKPLRVGSIPTRASIKFTYILLCFEELHENCATDS
jgi:hypothetical protein